MKTTPAEKAAAENRAAAFCTNSAAAALAARETAAQAFRAARAAAEVPFRETKAAAARAAAAARRAAENAEFLMDSFDPEPYSDEPGGLFSLTFQEIMAAHMELDAARAAAERAAEAAERRA